MGTGRILSVEHGAAGGVWNIYRGHPVLGSGLQFTPETQDWNLCCGALGLERRKGSGKVWATQKAGLDNRRLLQESLGFHCGGRVGASVGPRGLAFGFTVSSSSFALRAARPPPPRRLCLLLSVSLPPPDPLLHGSSTRSLLSRCWRLPGRDGEQPPKVPELGAGVGSGAGGQAAQP